MLGMGDGDQFARGCHGWIEQVILDTHVDVELHQQLIERLSTFIGGRWHRRDLLAQTAQNLVVLEQHVISIHSPTTLPDPIVAEALPRTSTIPSRTRAE